MANFTNAIVNLPTNSKLGFKIGLEANLRALETVQAGTLYLTSDSHRLFLGGADNTLAPVCQGVISVATQNDLPAVNENNKALTAGQFYYITADNILCVYNGAKWVQINSDTYVGAIEVATTAKNEHGVEVTTKVTNAGGRADSVISGVTFEGDFAGSGIDVAVEDNKVVISGDKYTLSTAADEAGATINLISERTDNDTTIKITSENESKLKVTSDENGNIRLDAKTGVASIAANNGTTSGFDFTVRGNDGSSVTAGIDPEVKYGSTGGSSAKFENGAAVLSVYTKAEVDNKIEAELRDLNAMVFKGTVGDGGTVASIPLTAAHGDTYRVNSSLTLAAANSANGDEIALKNGDMIVATGNEVDGVIENVQWVHIPSADEASTTYKFVNIENGVALKDNANNTVGTFAVTPGEGIVITQTGEEGASDKTVTIAHQDGAVVNAEDATVTQANKGSLEIIANTFDVDDFGHVTNKQKTTYTITDTHNNLNTFSHTIAAADDIATITQAINMTDGETKGISYTVGSSSLKVSALENNAGMTLDLEWGSF